jgi:hypothetical protein
MFMFQNLPCEPHLWASLSLIQEMKPEKITPPSSTMFIHKIVMPDSCFFIFHDSYARQNAHTFLFHKFLVKVRDEY